MFSLGGMIYSISEGDYGGDGGSINKISLCLGWSIIAELQLNGVVMITL